jgi:hypothetical protein
VMLWNEIEWMSFIDGWLHSYVICTYMQYSSLGRGTGNKQAALFLYSAVAEMSCFEKVETEPTSFGSFIESTSPLDSCLSPSVGERKCGRGSD